MNQTQQPTDISKEQGIDYAKWARECHINLFVGCPINQSYLKFLESFLRQFSEKVVRQDILRRAKEKVDNYPVMIPNNIILLSDLTALCTEDLTKEENSL